MAIIWIPTKMLIFPWSFLANILGWFILRTGQLIRNSYKFIEKGKEIEQFPLLEVYFPSVSPSTFFASDPIYFRDDNGKLEVWEWIKTQNSCIHTCRTIEGHKTNFFQKGYDWKNKLI